jgi:transcriptional regulator with XRE-family HTH domain
MAKYINKIDQYVGSRVQLQRSRLGMSQEALAFLLGMPKEQLNQYEEGAQRLDARRLLQITDILHVSPAYFFDGMTRGDAGRAQADAA